MRTIVKAWLSCALAIYLCTAALADPPKPIEDPDKHAESIMRTLTESGAAAAAKALIDNIGQPNAEAQVQHALEIFDSKKITYTDKVIDKQFGKSLRQIVYYAFVENTGFVYFRFNYKRSDHGWLLGYFNLKSENIELFPKDFVIQ